MQTMPIVHFLPYEVRHVVPKKLVPEKKPEVSGGDGEKGDGKAGGDGDQKQADAKKKKSPGRRRGKEGPPVAK